MCPPERDICRWLDSAARALRVAGGDGALRQPEARTAERPQRDLTSGGLGKHLLTLSVPATASMALFSVVGLVDAYWVGQLSSTALAAQAMASALRFALISPMMGLSAGGMAVVAHCIGARAQRAADNAVMQTILIVALLALPLSLLGQLAGGTLLRWMGGGGPLLAEAVAYMRIIFGGLLFVEMLPTMNGVIMGTGHPEYVLRFNLANIVVMMLLEPLLTLGLGPFPRLGIRGAAWATVLGSASGVAAQLWTLWRGGCGVRLHLSDIRPDPSMMRRVLKIALPTAAQRLSPNLAGALLIRLVSSFGSDVLTAYSVVIRLFGFSQTPPMGISQAVASMVGQNLGAGKPERAERSVTSGSLVSAATSLVLSAALVIWPAQLFGLFTDDSAVIAVGSIASRFMLTWATFLAWSTVVGRALVGAGDALSPMWVNIGTMWLVQLPLCWGLSGALGLGPQGIWLGSSLGTLLGAVAMELVFRRGGWKRVVV